MSPRRNVLQFVGIIAALCMLGALIAGPASAKRMSAKQKAHVRAELRKQVKQHPGIVNKKGFIKKASLVNFTLPVTIALRGTSTNANPNKATIDLGPSLGQREIDLGGKLAAEIRFHDSFDGGALGNVDLAILPSATKHLTSTSIPLLWNSQVSDPTTRWDGTVLLQNGAPAVGPAPGMAINPGCGNWHQATPTSTLGFGAPYLNAGAGYPGYPFSDPADIAHGGSGGFLPVQPGVEDIDNLASGAVPGSNEVLGNATNPFPQTASAPTHTVGGIEVPNTTPSVKDTVLRTTALDLGIAPVGKEVNQSTGTSDDGAGANVGPQGSQNVVTGASGGQANLFGNIPGKSYGIDVTVSLATQISSILRIVDQDSFGGLKTGDNWPAGIFGCRQTYTGQVQNYIPGVHLTGNLKIAPGITSSGKLRIAKATISTPNATNAAKADKARIALSACLMPDAPYTANGPGTTDGSLISDTTTIPGVASGWGFSPGTGLAALSSTASIGDPSYPTNPFVRRGAPRSVPCNSDPTATVKYSTGGSVHPPSVSALTGGLDAAYSTSNDGSRVSVAGDLTVNNVEVDVLVGDV